MVSAIVDPVTSCANSYNTRNVRHVRKELKAILPQYRQIQDCIDGAPAVKKRRTTYLPQPDPTNETEENRQRYEDYLTRAVFYNVTGRTLEGFVGQVFIREPVVNLPNSLDVVQADANGEGVPLNQQAKSATGYVIAKGRAGLFSDYPATSGEITVEEQQQGNINPTITLYQPEYIINWRTKTIGSKVYLSLVVLKEEYVCEDDGFETKTAWQYRVLRLNDDNVYTVEIWRSTSDAGFAPIEGGEVIPTDSAGNAFNEIPFTFIGSKNNDSEIDNPPLYDISELNIAHYRNSADYEESSYVVGQPTPYASGLTQQWVDEVMGGQLKMGSLGGVMLPENGEAGLIQAEPNQMPKEGMEHKERQMVALGAKLVEQQSVQRTATEAKMENASETSVLSSIASNVSAAYQKALTWCAQFVGAGDNIEYVLNNDFDTNHMSSQEIAQVISSWVDGAITFEEMRNRLTKAGLATLDLEDAEAKLEEEKQKRLAAQNQNTGQDGDSSDDEA